MSSAGLMELSVSKALDLFLSLTQLAVNFDHEVISWMIGQYDSLEQIDFSKFPFANHAVHCLEGFFAVNLDIVIGEIQSVRPAIRAPLVLNPFFEQRFVHGPILPSIRFGAREGPTKRPLGSIGRSTTSARREYNTEMAKEQNLVGLEELFYLKMDTLRKEP
jgi:hypothetical protein